jgi:aldehyde oxidoreductase
MRLERLNLRINGVDRFVTCDPENDSLAEVLRRMGLTGVKVGCGTGVCGARSVILNGEVVRSCTKKMKRVAEFSEIITIEGIGTPQHLHPLQQAWITRGGAQRGVCSPCFLVSAFGLFQQNLSPTREDVRQWFKEHHNICRCTGYKQLVDAVMAAAEVMRGEKTMKDIAYDFEAETEIYGSRRPRPTALAKVTGLADYGDDVALQTPPGTAHLAVVMAGAHHANIVSIDTGEAEAMPGVIKVLTGKDVKGSSSFPMQGMNPRQRGTGVRRFP